MEREAPASEDIVLSANINARIMKLIEEARQRHQSKVTSDGKERAQQPKSTPQGPLLSKSMPSRRPEAPLLAEEGPQAAKDDRQPEKEEGLPRKTGNHPARPGLDVSRDMGRPLHEVAHPPSLNDLDPHPPPDFCSSCQTIPKQCTKCSSDTSGRPTNARW